MHEKEARKVYEEWVKRFAKELHAFAFRLTGDVPIAEDLVQETFFEAWKGMSGLKDHS